MYIKCSTYPPRLPFTFKIPDLKFLQFKGISAISTILEVKYKIMTCFHRQISNQKGILKTIGYIYYTHI